MAEANDIANREAQAHCAVATGSAQDEAIETCRTWLWLQIKRESCVTTALDIFEDLAYWADNPERFKAAILSKPNTASEPRPPANP